jgi:uncharacterized repeat protein (TIGR02543 family)
MGLAGKSAIFMRRARHELRQWLAFILVASTLSVISVVSSPIANATSSTVDSALTLTKSSSMHGFSNTATAPLQGLTTYTVEAWIKPTTTCAGASVVTNTRCEVVLRDGDYDISIVSGTYQLVVYYGGTAWGFTDTRVPAVADSWTHIALTRSSASVTFYVNGFPRYINSNIGGSAAATFQNSPFRIGYAGYGSTHFDGQIDEVKLWNVARTSTQISERMSVAPSLTDSTLLAYYNFNEGTGTAVNNQKIGAATTSHLTLSGSPTWIDVKTEQTVGTDKVITFPRSYINSAGGWTVPVGLTTISIVVVGGGGGGGGDGGSGGGGGELRTSASQAVTAGNTAAISIGVGGAPGSWSDTTGTNGKAGSATTVTGLGSYTANGGSGGGGWTTKDPVAGGTGGTGGTGSNGGAGGGGPGNCAVPHSAARVVGSLYFGADGSNGPSTSVIASSTSYGGGGGGGLGADTSNVGDAARGSAGGSGGGGRGSNYKFAIGVSSSPIVGASAGESGTANMGGGGGGGAACNSHGNMNLGYDGVSQRTSGGAGGSGVVVIKYVNAPSISLSPSTISATVGSAVTSYSITSSGGPVASYSIPSADSTAITAAGLSFNTSSGLLSGTPTGDLASRSITITATNTSGTSTATFSLTINYVSCSPTTNPSPPTGYTILTFTSVTTCNWSVPSGVTSAELLVVAGGGGGGDSSSTGTLRTGGGGGAGGYFYSSSVGVTGSVVVSVGAAGTGAAASTTNGTSGGDSAFGTLKVGGGGYGNSWNFTTSQRAGAGRGGTDYVTGGSGGGGRSRGAGNNDAKLGGTAGTRASSGITFQGNSYTGSAGVAGGDGYEGDSASGAWGGAITSTSRTSSISGSSVVYSKPGPFLPWDSLGNNERPKTYGSGGAANYNYGSAETTGNELGGDGEQGVVIVRYVSTYTVTYSYNTADANNSTASATFSPGGTAITLPTPTRTGFSFSGWYTASSGGTLVGLGGASYSPSGTNPAITVHAQWVAPSGTVSVPSAPNTVTATGTSGGIQLSWAVPVSLGGRTISGYQVEYSTTGAANAWTVASSSIASNATSYTVTGLTNGTSYYVRIAALFSGGRGAYGYPWQKIYGTVTATRNSSNLITYQTGFGTASGDAFSQYSSFTRVRYLMRATYGGNANYADVDFAKALQNASSSSTSNFDSTTSIRIPSLGTGQTFTIQGDVYDLTVLAPSSVSVQNGHGFNGRVEIWPWDYSGTAHPDLPARTTSGTFDDSDSPTGASSYGSFQLHNITNGSTDYRQTVLAWNRHGLGAEIGFGNNTGTNSDWTFCALGGGYGSCASRTNFSMEIFVNAPIAVAANSTDSTLSTLTISSGTLSPSFDSATTSYTATVANGTSSLTVTPTRNQANATITVNGTAVNSGSASGPISLSVGTNTITVVVTAQDGTTTSYTITVTRAASFTITYLAGGGSGSAPTTPTSVSGGATFTTPANTFVRTGYTFAGWSDDTSTVGATLTYPTSGTVSANVTLTATWTPINCTVTETSASGYITQRITGAGSCVWATPTGITAIEIAVIAGGGGGGFGNLGGGGGAGEVLVSGGSATRSGTTVSGTSTIATTPATPNVVTIGAGGATGAALGSATSSGADSGWRKGGDGGSSSFGAITANGGGGGGGSTNSVGNPGGSGGGGATGGTGGARGSNSTPTGWSSFKETGASGPRGGGGGAGSAGGTSGGSGATVLGVLVAGGGYGWERSGANASLGGNGRTGATNYPYAGSAGAYTSAGVDGTGTGGGAGAPGGAGAVIIRYASIVEYTYNANSGTGTAPAAGSAQGGTAFTTAANPFTRDGFTFAGWYTTSTGTGGTAYTANASNTMQISASAIILYAKWTADSLTLTYNSNGGTSVSSVSTTTGGTIALAPTAPTKAGYTFAGWSATDGGVAVTFPYAHGKTVNFSLFAKWTTNTYTVTFVYNSATGGNSVETATVTTGLTPVTLPTPTRNGYTFDGWHSDAGLTTSVGAAGATYMPTVASLTPSVYAKWVALNYTVTYATTNSTGGAAPTDSTNYNIGNNVVIKGNTGSLVRTGYTFTGWTAASDGTGPLLNSGSTFTVSTSNMTFYPKWSANTYTITYNANGAAGSPAAATANYTSGDSGVTLTGQGSMLKTGFDWGGWSASPTGAALSGAYTTTANVTLYAVWNIKTITVTYDKGVASTASFTFFPTTASGTYGSAVTLNSSLDATVTISIGGTGILHRFVGWNDGTSVYRGNASFTLPAIDKTLTAEWVKVFGVRYSFNGGTPAENTSATDTECLLADSLCNDQQDIVTHAAPSRVGYSFAGWINQNGTSVPTAATTKITSENYLFYATWSPIPYTITYNTAGGSIAVTAFTKLIGETLTVTVAPTKNGYNFAGWSAPSGSGTAIFGPNAVYTVASSDVTFTAQWTPKVYTVIYDWNGGTGDITSNTTFTVGDAAITLPTVGNRVKDGFIFSGWSETNNGGLISGTYTPAENVTLYAIWGNGSFVTTYDPQGGTLSTLSATVLNGSQLNLPTPTRANFVLEGWFTAATGGTKVGNAGAAHQPGQSRTLYAQWTQSSLYGLAASSLTRVGTTTASSVSNTTFTTSNASSAVSVTVPAGSLPNGTTVNFDLVGDFSRAQGLLGATNSYIISVVVSWITSAGTVPNTATGLPIAVTITNASITAGMSVYGIVAGAVTLLGTATQDGTVTVNLTSDPEVVVVATKPGTPTNVTATSNATQQSVISWTAPSANGGSVITSYTATSNTNATCTTSTTSCTISGLTDSTSYTFTVTATNSLGTSAASSSASARTAGKPDAPTTLTASANGNKQSVISWTAPASDGGSAITGYTVTSSTGETCATATTSCTITGLLDDTSYTFTATATNALGTSDPSASATARTAAAVVSNVGGDSGGGGGNTTPAPSTPAPTEPVVPTTPVKSNVTVVAPIVVVGDQDAKVLTIDVLTPVAGTNIKPATFKIDSASEKFIAEVKAVEGKLVLTPETGFSGKRTVTVTITENGVDRIVQIPLTVLPELVTKPVLTPTASNRSVIRWVESPNATTYTVFLNGKRVCSTSATSCNVNRILGPDAVIEIVSNGGDRTVSQKIEADFRQTNPVSITRLVSATITKSTLTAVDTKALDKVVSLIKTQGFGTVVISQITTTSKTKALAAARIESIKKYITSKVGTDEVEFEVTPVKSRTYFNNISVKG